MWDPDLGSNLHISFRVHGQSKLISLPHSCGFLVWCRFEALSSGMPACLVTMSRCQPKLTAASLAGEAGMGQVDSGQLPAAPLRASHIPTPNPAPSHLCQSVKIRCCICTRLGPMSNIVHPGKKRLGLSWQSHWCTKH